MIKIEGKTVLVTGASGFIGSHLTEELVKNGAKVKAYIREALDKMTEENMTNQVVYNC